MDNRIAAAARAYKARGWNPVPLRRATKAPIETAWQHSTIPDDQIDAIFTPDRNIGVTTGQRSYNMLDVDLDHPIVAKMAGLFLPRTGSIFGRPGKPGSHQIFYGYHDAAKYTAAKQDVPDKFPHRSFALPGPPSQMLVEIRGDGNQTMFPPSIHPSGEPVSWVSDEPPAIVDFLDLECRAGWLSAAGLLVIGWPEWKDIRHGITLALAGWMLKSGREMLGQHVTLSPLAVENFVQAVCIYAGDHEPDDRIRAVRDTAAKLDADPNAVITGFPTLRELIGATNAQKLAKWLQISKLGDEITPTDEGNALLLVNKFGDRLRFVHHHNAWYLWNGSYWQKDEQEQIIGFAREIGHDILTRAATIEDSTIRDRVLKFGHSSLNAARLFNMPKIARADGRITLRADDLDRDPMLLHAPNGTINLHTGGLQPPEQSDYITKSVAIPYNPRATCPLWLGFLDLVFAKNRELIDHFQCLCGYTLTGSTAEKIFVLAIGTTGTGKTTAIDTVANILGDYAISTAAATFIQRQSTGRATPEIARLHGARMIGTSETDEGAKLATALIKRFSGNTKMVASHLYAPEFSFIPAGKIWIDTNHKPRIPAHDDAVWERLIYLPFNVKIGGTPIDVKDYKSVLQHEWPGILTWMVEGVTRYRYEGLRRPQISVTASDDYRAESDLFAEFIEERCRIRADERVLVTTLHKAYVGWSNTSVPIGRGTFANRIEERGFPRRRFSNGINFEGIGLKIPGTEDTTDGQFNPLA
jgi:putative DNA primase/helicase